MVTFSDKLNKSEFRDQFKFVDLKDDIKSVKTDLSLRFDKIDVRFDKLDAKIDRLLYAIIGGMSLILVAMVSGWLLLNH